MVQPRPLLSAAFVARARAAAADAVAPLPADAPAYNTATTLRRASPPETCGYRVIALSARGGDRLTPRPHYRVVDTGALIPVRGDWPYNADGLRAATAAYEALCARLGAVEVA